jgi:hypothetical protein
MPRWDRPKTFRFVLLTGNTLRNSRLFLIVADKFFLLLAIFVDDTGVKFIFWLLLRVKHLLYSKL